MNHVTITIRQEGNEEWPIVRTMDYTDKDKAIADAPGIAEFIANYVK